MLMGFPRVFPVSLLKKVLRLGLQVRLPAITKIVEGRNYVISV
jgi:hypothetical protein